MANSVIIGSQWGDEGKAKVIDFLTEDADLIIRYQGGANAGHTVVVDGEKFVFHMVPSGIMYPNKKCIITNGVVFDAEQFLLEVNELAERGFDMDGRLFISDLAHLVLPYHKIVDVAREESRAKGKKIGTTGRGIGPCYADKATRNGIRLGDLKNWDLFSKKVEENFNEKKRLVEVYYGGAFEMTMKDGSKQELTLEYLLTLYKEIANTLSPLIIDTAHYIFEADQAGQTLLFEGAQGTFLDIDHGTYPFVTSSNTIIGSVATGTGINTRTIDDTIAIVKTYTTRVGNGPFPTEQLNAIGEQLGKQGHEFGSTTGRQRRCGWFDAVLLRKSIQLNGFTTMALMKLDVLSGFEELQICTHYKIDGVTTDQYPTQLSELEKVIPIYETMPGWSEDITGCTTVEELPENAQNYVTRLRELCYNLPVMMISVGPDRRETISIS